MSLPLSTIAKVVLILLNIADKFSDLLIQKKYQDQGYQKAVAEANAKMLKKNTFAKEVMQRVNNMSDSDVDKQLRELEPKP